MKLGLFRQIVELNQSFDHLIAGLTKLESVPFFQRDLIQHARSDVEIARVHANREFFDNFEEIVENDSKWAYRFQRAYDAKLKDRDDIYLEIRNSEERRKRKESSSCRIGICPMKIVMTKSGAQSGRNPQRDGIGLTESPLRNRNRWLKKPGLSQLRKRGDDVHEKANAP